MANITIHGVLAGAYRGGRKSLAITLTHASADGGSTSLCGKTENLCDLVEEGPATCKACARKAGRYTKADPCDACGRACNEAERYTDDEVCGCSDGPGFYLCHRKRCITARDPPLEERRTLYTAQREINNSKRRAWT